MFDVAGRSAWHFVTSGTGGIGLSFVVGSGGEIVLDDPDKREHRFRYGGIGVGLSFGLKRVPHLGRFDARGLSEKGGSMIAPEDFPNHGVVYRMAGCMGPELSADDLRGMCVFYDAGFGLIAGYAAEIMLMGCDPAALMMAASPIGALMVDELLRPRAMLVSWGPNVGLQASAGVSGSLGLLT